MKAIDPSTQIDPPAVSQARTVPPLVLPSYTDSQAALADDQLQELRRWHHEAPAGDPLIPPPGAEHLPALLHAFREPAKVRHAYPLLLLGREPGGDGPPAQPLSDMLRRGAETLGCDADTARILKDNLLRLERHIRLLLRDAVCDEPIDAQPLLDEAAKRLEVELDLSGDSRDTLHSDLGRLLEALPAEARLLALSESSALHLFVHTAGHLAQTRRAALRQEVRDLRNRLRDLLRVEDSKTRDPGVGHLDDSHLNGEALAHVLGPERGSVRMSAERRARIKAVLETFERYLADDEGLPLTIVSRADATGLPKGPASVYQAVVAQNICGTAIEAFDGRARETTALLADMRVGRLEVAGEYEPARHDRLLTGFDWHALTRKERAHLPVVLAVESAEQLAASGTATLSRLLLSGRPIHVFVFVHPATNPAATTTPDALADVRLELGYLGISHRVAAVQQSSAGRPDHMIEGFEHSLNATCASLHLITSGLTAAGEPSCVGGYLHAEAAMEARAHPLFHFQPEAGSTWASRLDLNGNSGLKQAWPAEELTCQDTQGKPQAISLAFTFADFCLLEPSLRGHFCCLPEVDDGLFIPLAECLELDPDTAAERLPYIWSADAQGRLRRLLVSEALVNACHDRLGYWRMLQELAGINNEHVRVAVEHERQRLEAEHAEQLAAQEQTWTQQVEQARAGAAREALEKLAETLLEVDLTSLPAVAAPQPATQEPSPQPVDQPEAVVEEEVEEEEADEPEEPWINIALCTSCNDCTDINPRLFVYNGNKQATIGDPTAGTFDELVKAAEKCPAKCIHPGKPLNHDEPNLEELVKRAKPFQ